AGIYVHRELAKVALTKTVGRNRATDELLSKLAGAFGELQRAFDSAVPDAIDQIELRSAPLRELWDARGGGLLAGIGRLTEPELIVQQADVLLLKPALGGAGSAHLPYNSVSIEAVLTNPQAALPETLRLAWLLAQLHHDLPMHQGN